jgi:hypothetical protein
LGAEYSFVTRELQVSPLSLLLSVILTWVNMAGQTADEQELYRVSLQNVLSENLIFTSI